MSRPPFRFAVQATNASGAREWRDTALKVQDLGYSTLFLADHYLGPGPAQRAARTPRQDLAPIAAMATAAAVTETLRIGCRVFCIDYHVPAVLAKEAATLDLLSDGRLELGIGAGWSADEYSAMGLTFDRPGRRITKLEEVIGLFKAHFAGEEIDSCGRVRQRVRVCRSSAAGSAAPSSDHGRRSRDSACSSLAAREADIVSISNVPFVAHNEAGLDPRVGGATAQQVTCARQQPIGFENLEIESSPYFTEITDDAERALANLASATGISADILREHPNVLIGSVDTVVEVLQSRREELGINYVTVQQPRLDAFAPIVARLHGL